MKRCTGRPSAGTQRSTFDPHELHTIGLDLVENLKRELSESPKLRYTSAEEMIEDAEAAVRRAEAVAPHWFRTMPDQRCVISATAPSVPAGTPPHYLPAALDGSRPGTYFVNTTQPHTRLRTVAEATAFHEAVPGHHFESARLTLRQDLPLCQSDVDRRAYQLVDGETERGGERRHQAGRKGRCRKAGQG